MSNMARPLSGAEREGWGTAVRVLFSAESSGLFAFMGLKFRVYTDQTEDE